MRAQTASSRGVFLRQDTEATRDATFSTAGEHRSTEGAQAGQNFGGGT